MQGFDMQYEAKKHLLTTDTIAEQEVGRHDGRESRQADSGELSKPPMKSCTSAWQKDHSLPTQNLMSPIIRIRQAEIRQA